MNAIVPLLISVASAGDGGVASVATAFRDRPLADRCSLVLRILHSKEPDAKSSFFETVRDWKQRKGPSRLLVDVNLFKHHEGTKGTPAFSETEVCRDRTFEIIQSSTQRNENTGIPIGALDLVPRGTDKYEFFGSVITFHGPGKGVGNVLCGQTHGEVLGTDGSAHVSLTGVPLPPGFPKKEEPDGGP
jgi:hypothetical protein